MPTSMCTSKDLHSSLAGGCIGKILFILICYIMLGVFSGYFEHGYTSMSQLESCTDIAGPAQPSSAPEVMTDLGWSELQLLGRTN